MLRKNNKSQSTRGLQEFEQVDFSGGINSGTSTKLDPTMIDDKEKLDSLNIFLDSQMTQTTRGGIVPHFNNTGINLPSYIDDNGINHTPDHIQQDAIDAYRETGEHYPGVSVSLGTNNNDHVITNAFFTYPNKDGLEFYQGTSNELYKYNPTTQEWDSVFCTYKLNEFDNDVTEPIRFATETVTHEDGTTSEKGVFYKEAFMNGFITLPTGLGVYLYDGTTWKLIGDVGLEDPNNDNEYLREPTLIPDEILKAALGYNTMHPDGPDAWRDYNVDEPTLQRLSILDNKTNQAKPSETFTNRLHWAVADGDTKKRLCWDIQVFPYVNSLPSDPADITFTSIKDSNNSAYSIPAIDFKSIRPYYDSYGAEQDIGEFEVEAVNDLLSPFVAAGFTGKQHLSSGPETHVQSLGDSWRYTPLRYDKGTNDIRDAYGILLSDTDYASIDRQNIDVETDFELLEDKEGDPYDIMLDGGRWLYNVTDSTLDTPYSVGRPTNLFIRAVLYEVDNNGFEGRGFDFFDDVGNTEWDLHGIGLPYINFTVLDTVEIPDFEITTNPDIPNDLLTNQIISKVRNAIAYKSRFYLFNNAEAPQIVNISDITNYDYYPYYYHIVPQIDSGEDINFLFQRQTSLLLSTDRETRNLVGTEPISLTDDTSNVFNNKIQYQTVGSNSFRTYKYYEDQVIGLTSEGIKVMKTKTFATDDIDKGTNIDTPIDSLVPTTDLDKCHAQIIDQRYWLFKPDGEALVYDMYFSGNKPSWGRFKTRLPNVMATTLVGGSVYLLLQNGLVCRYGEGSDDWGWPIDIEWITKGYTGTQDTKDLHKSFQHIVLETSYVERDANEQDYGTGNEIKVQVGVDSSHIARDTTRVSSSIAPGGTSYNYTFAQNQEQYASISDILNNNVNTLGTWELGSDRTSSTHFGEQSLETRLNLSASRKLNTNGRYLNVRVFGTTKKPFTIRKLIIGAKVFQSKFTKIKRRKDYGWD